MKKIILGLTFALGFLSGSANNSKTNHYIKHKNLLIRVSPIEYFEKDGANNPWNFTTCLNTQCLNSTAPRKGYGAYKCLSDLYSTIDPKILVSKDEDKLNKLFSEKAPLIRDYIKNSYGEDFSSLSDVQVFVAGTAVAAIEKDNLKLNTETARYVILEGPGDAFSCLMAAVGAVTGIGTLASTIQGATMATALGVVKTIFGVYFSAFAAAWAVYEFGDCMGWW